VRPYSKAVCDFAPSLSECESDTPRVAGGLVSGAASKPVLPLV